MYNRLFHTAPILLFIASTGHAATPASQDTQALADAVVKAYATLDGLAFDGEVEERRSTAERGPQEPAIRATFRVSMADRGRLHLVVHEPGRAEPVLTRVCDGTTVHEWNGTSYAKLPRAFEIGNVYVESDFEFCYVGGYLASWVGPDTPRMATFRERIAGGRIVGAQRIDGHLCTRVVYTRWLPNGEGVPNRHAIRDTFFVDQDSRLLRGWTTEQTMLTAQRHTEWSIQRDRRYTNIRTGPLPKETFVPRPPPGRETVPVATPADLLNKPLPKLVVRTWLHGGERLGGDDAEPLPIPDDGALLLNVLYPGCAACKAALPELSELASGHRANGLRVVLLSTSAEADNVKKLLGDALAEHAVGILAEDAEDPLHLCGYPTYFVVDRAGVVRWVGMGELPPSDVISTHLPGGE